MNVSCHSKYPSHVEAVCWFGSLQDQEVEDYYHHIKEANLQSHKIGDDST